MRLPTALALLLVAAGAATAEPLARDVAVESGIDFVHAGFRYGAGRDRSAYFEETAGGACWLDFDRDGFLDVFLTDFLDPDGNGRSRLYRNLGPPDWRFEDATVRANAGLRGVGQGCAAGDYDNDGWTDLYATFVVTNFSAQGNVLLRNVGGAFEDATHRARVTGDATREDATPCLPVLELPDGSTRALCWSVSAAWLDYDLDGDLDLYVAGYAQYPYGACASLFDGTPVVCAGQANRLYRNDGGVFEDVAEATGVAFNSQPSLGRSLGVIATDFDADRWPDLYVTNDMDANALYVNENGSGFRDVAKTLGVDNFGPLEARADAHRAGMGVDAGDLDGDGDVDLYSTHLAGEYDGVYLREGERFRDAARELGLGDPALDVSRWGGEFEDFDLDGDADVMVVAGGQARAEPGPVWLLLQENGTFARASDWPFVDAHRANHRGLSLADYDEDGDLDALVTTLPTWHGPEARPKLLRFDAPGNSLKVSLVGTDGARDVVGARVDVASDAGLQTQWSASGGGYAGSRDPRLVFGLGNATRGEIAVTWPGGEISRAAFDLQGNRTAHVRLVEPSVRAPPPVAWLVAGGHVAEWAPSLASDFARYRVTFDGDVVAEVEDRGATQFVLPAKSGRVEVVVVDASGLASAPAGAVVEGRALPALALLSVVGAAALVARLRRR